MTFRIFPILTLYLKANPETKVVSTASAPNDTQIAAWQPGAYLLAIYPDEGALSAVKARNAFVLPLTRASFDAITAAPYTVFVTEDHSWRHVTAAVAAEIDAYNQKTAAVAAAAGQVTSTEKLIAYKYDTALAQLLARVLPQGKGWVGFVLAALLGAVVSSLAAMLNAASTILAMDIFKKHLSPKAEQKAIVLVGRLSVVVFALIAVALAPQLGSPRIGNSIFSIIQEGQGFISSGILSVFIFGLLVRKAPKVCGVAGLMTNIVSYGLLKMTMPGIQFVNRMAVSFALCLLVLAIITVVKPLPRSFEFRHSTTVALESSKSAQRAGWVVIVLTVALYAIFSPWGVAK